MKLFEVLIDPHNAEEEELRTYIVESTSIVHAQSVACQHYIRATDCPGVPGEVISISLLADNANFHCDFRVP
jgi:hypothetical protein